MPARPSLLARAVRAIRRGLGLPMRIDSDDRRVLEGEILPFYAARKDVRSVLFVGTRDYTAWYPRLLPRVRWHTIEPDPAARRYGGPSHVVDGLENVGAHFRRGSIDLVICNGVFGWGLDDKPRCELAFDGCAFVLRPRGELVIGWNDVPERRPFALDTLSSLARFFERVDFSPRNSHRIETATANRHRYDFFRTRAA